MSTASREVVIVDGGGANIASLNLALQRLGYTGQLSSDPAIIRAASHVILPGVGAARAAMERLQKAGLVSVIPELRQPVLGICLGLQLLFESSEEDDVACLGILPGRVRRFAPAPERPIPHMGWNQITRKRESPLLDGVPDDSYFYFVHSYAADVSDDTIATTDYGRLFTAVAGRDNFYAAQFHPERSGPLGARILENFLGRC
ncbi:MAG: imidazole glycerol phosphate synthase subunit HisH [Gammaproteobacteria bacterium]|nr:imidazole glycerol phosphate synthase subunit HisH [Gammaproteobacteria bacterium]MCP5138736.1 imidazole glycerol phosphate synthase subunit HisH [Chromatiales bacterium]